MIQQDELARTVDSPRRLFPKLTIARFGLVIVIALMAVTAAVQMSDAARAFQGRRASDTDALDFTVFFTAARFVRDGRSDLLFTTSAFSGPEHSYGVHALAEDETLPYLNPPFFAASLAPLSSLTFNDAFRAWFLVNLAGLVLTCALLFWASRGQPVALRVCLLALTVTMRPNAFSLQLGQFSLLLLAAWTAAYCALRAGHERLSGIALAACLIKPEIVLLVVPLLYWRRRLSAVRTFAVVAIGLVLLSIAVTGPGGLAEYPRYLLTTAVHRGEGTSPEFMVGWNGLGAPYLGTWSPGVETAIVLPLSILTVGGVAWLLFQRSRVSPRAIEPAEWLLVTIATALVDPHFYLQDAALLAAPAYLYLLSTESTERRVAWLAVFGGWWVAAFGLDPNLHWHVALFPLMMAVCGGSLAVHLWRDYVSERERPTPTTYDKAALSTAP